MRVIVRQNITLDCEAHRAASEPIRRWRRAVWGREQHEIGISPLSGKGVNSSHSCIISDYSPPAVNASRWAADNKSLKQEKEYENIP